MSRRSSTTLKFHLFLTATVLYAFLIFYLSSTSHPPVPHGAEKVHGFPEMSHFFLYLGLGILIRLTLLSSHFEDVRENSAPLAVWTGYIYALIDEIHQWFIPGRTPSWNDVLIDLSGLLAAQFLFYMFYRILAKKLLQGEHVRAHHR